MTSNISTAEEAGAVGDGKTDDARFINRLSLSMSRQGGGTIIFNPEKRYYITQSIMIYPGITMQGGGATLQTDRDIFFMTAPNPSFNGRMYEPSYTALSPQNPQQILAATAITASPVAGTNVISVDRSTGFSIGDAVCIRLGQNPTDPPEAHIVLMAKIIAIGGNSLTIDKRFPITTLLAGVNVQNAMVFKYKHNVDGAAVSGFNFEDLDGADVEGGLWLEWCQNIRLNDLTANRYGGLNMGAGIVSVVRANSILAKNLHTFRNENTTAQTSKGRHIGIAYSKDCLFETQIADNCQSWIAFMEGYSDGIDLKDVTYHDSSASTSVKTLFIATEGTEYVVDGLTVDANSPLSLDDDGGTYAFGTIKNINITTRRGKFPVAGTSARIAGRYTYSDESNRFTVDFDRQQSYDFLIYLAPRMHESFTVPEGVVVETSVYASRDCIGVTGFYKGTTSNGRDRSYLISPGNWESDLFHAENAIFGYAPYSSFADTVTPTKYLLSTGPGTSGYLLLRCVIAPFLMINGVQKTPFRADDPSVSIRSKP